MKARIKATGEIINIADYAKITLDTCDSWGNPIEVQPEEIELIQEVSKDEHWQDVKERAAIAAMQGILANTYLHHTANNGTYREIVIRAIDYATELVNKLKEE